MKHTMQQLLAEYASSHQNAINKRIHYMAVPIIFWSITAMLWVVKIPYADNLAIIATVLISLYYISKDVLVAIQMLLLSICCLILNAWLESRGLPLIYWALGLFVVAWIFQFIGHHIEGKKPSFFKDIQFLLIGPAWIVKELFARKS